MAENHDDVQKPINQNLNHQMKKKPYQETADKAVLCKLTKNTKKFFEYEIAMKNESIKNLIS